MKWALGLALAVVVVLRIADRWHERRRHPQGLTSAFDAHNRKEDR